MSDTIDPVPRKGESYGVKSYRLLMMGMMAIALMAAKGAYDKLDKTMDTMFTVERSITALNGRLDAQAERLAAHDRRFDRLEDCVFINPRATP